MNTAKQRQKTRGKAKRNVQNQRTFLNVQRRRKAHVEAHRGMTMNDLGARRWTVKPTAKA